MNNGKGLFLDQGAPALDEPCQENYSLHQCEDLCDNTPNCMSFSYNPGIEWCCTKKRCGSKSEPTDAVHRGWTSYYKACPSHMNTDKKLFLGQGAHSSLLTVNLMSCHYPNS